MPHPAIALLLLVPVLLATDAAGADAVEPEAPGGATRAESVPRNRAAEWIELTLRTALESQSLVAARALLANLTVEQWDALPGETCVANGNARVMTLVVLEDEEACLVVPHPADRWTGDRRDLKSYPLVPWTGYPGTLSSTFDKASESTCLAWQIEDGSVLSVFRYPIAIGPGRLFLMANDVYRDDNDGSIRVKLIRKAAGSF